MQPLAADSLVGPYRIVGHLGTGGMGVIYCADHLPTRRRCALKVIRSEIARDPELVGRFFNEARALVRLSHPHIVQVYEAGTAADGSCYLAMELLEGESLGARLRQQGALPARAALQIAAQVATALGAAHDRRILHRDLKPENVFLVPRADDPFFIKVLDFGLAKLLDDEQPFAQTRIGALMGTPHYMSPEQCAGAGGVDQRSDTYALGIILFEMLTGRVPFTADGFGQILVKHMTEPVPAPSSLDGEIPPFLDEIVLRALAKDAGDRFQTMAEVGEAIADALAALGEATAIAFQPVPPAESAEPPLAPLRDRPAAVESAIVDPIAATAYDLSPPELLGVSLAGGGLHERRTVVLDLRIPNRPLPTLPPELAESPSERTVVSVTPEPLTPTPLIAPLGPALPSRPPRRVDAETIWHSIAAIERTVVPLVQSLVRPLVATRSRRLALVSVAGAALGMALLALILR